MEPVPAALRERVAAELVPPADAAGAAAGAFVTPIRRRHGGAVAAILFYGSCLRRGSAEGVLDFYVLVDAYRDAYRPGRGAAGRAALALANAALPPNVFYLELDAGPRRLRAKYAVMSRRAFARAAGREAWQPRIWARFAQPAALVWARDATAREEVAEAVARATCTTLDWAACWAADASGAAPADPRALLETALRETYRAELRSERTQAVRSLAGDAAARRAPALQAALHALAAEGRLAREAGSGGPPRLRVAPRRRARARARWALQRRVAKALAVAGLVKTAGTFDGWVGYVVWKLERHGARPIHLSERQRRHPFLFGWPVLLRLLRSRVLR